MKTLSVVCPVYQEADVIADFYYSLKKVLNNLVNYKSEIIFVVDRGADNTVEILKEICRRDREHRRRSKPLACRR